jgi:two-component system, cell cycle response regulator
MKILLAEDSAIYRHLISGHLKEWDFDLVIAKDGEEAWLQLQGADPPRLVLLDWVLPKMEGIELCQKIRQSGTQTNYTYIVLLTAKDSKNELLEGLAAGADDYLVKPFDPPELRARLLVGKRILELQQELVGARESLRVAASYDFLTGLLNRREILAFLEREMVRSKRQRSPIGVILTDIDHFKKINDTLGHLAGDAVLKEVANRIRAHLRPYDGAGRYGGEEFLMILPGCDLATTIRRAEEIRTSISATEVETRTGPARVTASMGATWGLFESKPNIEALLHEADTALYRAKHNGRDRVEAFSGTSGH